MSVSPDGTELGTITVSRESMAGWESQEGPLAFVSPAGLLALDVCRVGGCAWAIFDLRQPQLAARIVDAPPGLTFLPTGTLVGMDDHLTELRRLRSPYDGLLLRTAIPTGIWVPYSEGMPVAADGSGVYGIRTDAPITGDWWGPEELVTWDGRAHPVDPAVEPYQMLGTQRIVGAEGQTVMSRRNARGQRLPNGFVVRGPSTPRFETDRGSWQGNVWADGGRSLLFYDSDVVWALHGESIDLLVKLPPLTSEYDTWGQIWGVSPDTIVFHDQGFETWHVVSIATGQYVPVPGIVAGIVP